MRVEMQGDSECMLATIAALSDRTLAEVRTIACGKAGVRVWRALFRKPRGERHMIFARAITATCAEIDPSGRLAAMIRRADLVVAASTGVTVHESPRTLPNGDLPPTGRGTVTVCTRSRARAHIAPWENGLVYDPNFPDSPLTLAEFSTAYRLRHRMHILAVTVAVVSSNPEDCISPSPDMGY